MPVIINRDTLIPLGVVASIFIGIGALAFWLNGQFNEVKTQFVGMDKRLTVIEAAASDRYPRTAAAEDALRNAIANPGVKFSDPRNPGEYIVVTVDARRSE